VFIVPDFDDFVVLRDVVFVDCIEAKVLAWSVHVGLAAMVDWSEDKPVEYNKVDAVCRGSSQIYGLLNGINTRVTPWGIWSLVNYSPECLDIVAEGGFDTQGLYDREGFGDSALSA
jgi:hypothetical protein